MSGTSPVYIGQEFHEYARISYEYLVLQQLLRVIRFFCLTVITVVPHHEEAQNILMFIV